MDGENGLTEAVPQRRSLSERIEAERKAHAAESEVPAPSYMAERFAPEPAAGPLPHLRAAAAGRIAVPPRPRSSLAGLTLTALMSTVALIPSLALAALYWRDSIEIPDWVPMPAVWAGKETSAQPEAVTASVAAPETILQKHGIERPAVALALPALVEGQAGEDTQFAIALDSKDRLPLRSIISVRGLPQGATFSAGRPYGETEWSLRPDEIGDLILTVPQSVSGEHQVSVALLAADGTTIASGTTKLAIAPDPKAALILRPDDKARIEELIAHGQKMIDVGYLAGARGYLKRAAEAGSAEAALALGDTYDPGFIAEIGARGIPPDFGQARNWYERAKMLGSSMAADRIAKLEEAAGAAKSMPVPQQELAEADDESPGGAPDVAAPEATASSQAPDPAIDSEWVETSGAVNVRASPAPNAQTIKIAEPGTRYRATGRKGRWVQVMDPKTSEVGWVYSRFVAASGAP